MSISISSSQPATSLADAFKTVAKVADKSAAQKTAETDFLKHAQMTPAERMHTAMLAKFGLTKEQFDQLDPKAKGEIADKIRDEIKKQLEASGTMRTGVITDKKV